MWLLAPWLLTFLVCRRGSALHEGLGGPGIAGRRGPGTAVCKQLARRWQTPIKIAVLRRYRHARQGRQRRTSRRAQRARTSARQARIASWWASSAGAQKRHCTGTGACQAQCIPHTGQQHAGLLWQDRIKANGANIDVLQWAWLKARSHIPINGEGRRGCRNRLKGSQARCGRPPERASGR